MRSMCVCVNVRCSFPTQAQPPTADSRRAKRWRSLRTIQLLLICSFVVFLSFILIVTSSTIDIFFEITKFSKILSKFTFISNILRNLTNFLNFFEKKGQFRKYFRKFGNFEKSVMVDEVNISLKICLS